MKNKHKKVYKYFEDFNSELLSKLILTKKGKGKNKELANKLFSIESDMMAQNIIDLSKIGIEVYYVFDELIGKEQDIDIIKEVMTKNLKIFNIDTVVK